LPTGLIDLNHLIKSSNKNHDLNQAIKIKKMSKSKNQSF